jgi:molybdate transport system substrate-binding protein
MVRRLAAVPALMLAACGGSAPGVLTVSAAASLQNALAPIAEAFTKTHPRVKVEFNFGASGALARQIEDGAPADVFFSAASGAMDELEARGLVVAGTRRDLLRGEMVLIVPHGREEPSSFAALPAPGVKLIALADPASVPAGQYGKQVLAYFHVWDSVSGKLVLAKDVRQVLGYVETGNADAGIVYATDARQSAKVRVAAVAPETSHAPVVYPAAVVRGARSEAAAREFVAFLGSPEARAICVAQGFTAAAP